MGEDCSCRNGARRREDSGGGFEDEGRSTVRFLEVRNRSDDTLDVAYHWRRRRHCEGMN